MLLLQYGLNIEKKKAEKYMVGWYKEIVLSSDSYPKEEGTRLRSSKKSCE